MIHTTEQRQRNEKVIESIIKDSNGVFYRVLIAKVMKSIHCQKRTALNYLQMYKDLDYFEVNNTIVEIKGVEKSGNKRKRPYITEGRKN